MFGTFTILIALFVCGSSATERTLVLIDSYAAKETYSQFYDLLSSNGHSLTFRLVDDSSLALSKYGDYLYENVMIMSNNVEEFGGELDVAKLVEFVDKATGNVFVATDSNVGSAVREFLLECGIELDEKSKAEDYFYSYEKPIDGDENAASVLKVASGNFLRSETIVGHRRGDVLYRGSALTIDTDNPLVYPVLRVPKTAFARTGSTIVPPGSDRMLMAALQARNNARVFVSASLDFFSDRFFAASVQNRNVAETLALWTFQQRGVIRTSLIRHYQPENGQMPPVHNYYTVGDPVVYEIAIEQKQAPHSNGNASVASWIPFEKADDLQLEFVRIDPFVRITLAYDSSAQLFRGRFRIPDVYGVYKFKVFYARVGWSFVHSETQVSVRPLRHTQYERFILNAYPYYASAFSMMGSLFLFILFYLYADFAPNAHHHSDKKQK